MDIGNIDSHWWWFIAGVALILAEFSVPGVYVCFFGIGAILTGIVAWLFPAVPLTAELFIFAFLSVVFLLVCRRFMPKSFRGTVKVDISDIENDDIADAEVVVLEAITPNAPGKVEFRGALWTARAERSIAVGERAKIRERRNLTLYLK